MTQKQIYQNRTAIVHFGATKQDYLDLVQSEDRKALIAHLQAPFQAQLSVEVHGEYIVEIKSLPIGSIKLHRLPID